MPVIEKKSLVCQTLIVFAALILLGGCEMPDKPDGADMEGFGRIGDQLRARGDDGGAASFYQRALAHKPDDSHARIALAEILEAHGDNADAASQYRIGIQLDPEDGAMHRGLGRVLLKLHQPAEARAEYAQALKIDEADTKALNGLGVALDYLGQHAAAQDAYKEALDNDADDYATMNNLAHSYVLTGAYDQAIALLEPHLKDKGATPALRQNLAEAYGMAGMDADAERVARIDLSPEQIKHNLDFYRKARAEVTPTAALAAILGTYPTEAMAEANKETIANSFARELEGLVLEVKPEVGSIGGTPKFVLQASGFSSAAKLRSFCDKLKKAGNACKAEGLK